MKTLTKAEQRIEARKAYDAIKDPAFKAYQAINEPAYKAYDAITDPALKAYRAKLVEIDARPPEEIITVDGRKYKLMEVSDDHR